jgi:RNA polymerase sigma-70 factor (ECF subfamily)
LGGRLDPDDVVQDIYRKVLRSRCSDLANPRAWIWTIAWRVVNDAFQHEKRHRHYHVPAEPKVIEALARQEHATFTSPIESQMEARDEILSALQDLPAATQIAIVRSRRDGWSYDQIAAELGITPHMVKKHIVRAIAHFTAYLEVADAKSAKQGVST